MTPNNVLKMASMALTLAGAAVSLASGFVEDKKMEVKIAEKVAEALKQVSK